jgi:hypothetical protein
MELISSGEVGKTLETLAYDVQSKNDAKQQQALCALNENGKILY